MARCIDDLFTKWNHGNTDDETGAMSISHMAKWRNKHQKNDPFKNYKVLRVGEPIPFDMYSPNERINIMEKHVFWLQLEDGTIKACLKEKKNNVFKEISLHLCQAIWPNVHTRDIGKNERILPNGVVIPIIPTKFFNYKKHNQKKSKTSRNK